jgi:DNA-binding transcriptional LysR family regulator
LRRYAVCVAVHPAHPLTRARRVSLRSLKSERLIVYTRQDYPEYHVWLTALFKPLGGLPAIAEEHDSVTSLIASVEAGHGAALVPECLSCMAGPRLKLRVLVDPLDPFVVGLAFRKGAPGDLVKRFLEAARQASGEV